jgi:hypothetical protein
MQQTCSGTTNAGQACKAKALPGSAFCIAHDPAKAAQMAEWRRKGGRAKSNQARAKKALPAEPLSTVELHSYLGLVFRGVISGKLAPNVGTSSAAIARTMLELVRAIDLESRIAELERRITDVES